MQVKSLAPWAGLDLCPGILGARSPSGLTARGSLDASLGEVDRGSADQHLTRAAQEREVPRKVAIDDEHVGGIPRGELAGLPP